MGIIYLIQPELIRNLTFHSFHLQLYCNSTIIPSFATNITVDENLFLHAKRRKKQRKTFSNIFFQINLLNAPDNERICEDDELCAVHADSKSCEMTCGYGSRGKCMWRHEPEFNNSIGTCLQITHNSADVVMKVKLAWVVLYELGKKQ